MRQQRSKTRRGFTLVEIMTVVIIVGILIALLLPAIAVLRRKANTGAMKLDFQTIAAALENYKNDFRDYPKNPFAMLDAPSVAAQAPDAYRPVPPRTDACLAMALLGPGAANAVYGRTSPPVNGDPDGVDGPGYRSEYALVDGTDYTFASYTPGNPGSLPTITLNSSLPASLQVPPSVTGSMPPFSVISLGGAGSPDAHVPIVSANGSTITLAWALQDTNANADYLRTPVALMRPTGKTWGPYLPVDKLKVGYILSDVHPLSNPAVFGSPYSVNLPVLLDLWNNPILYFPAYNNYANRMPNTSTVLTNTPTQTSKGFSIPNMKFPVTIGPLFGSPSAALANFVNNSPIDSAGDTIPSVFWSGPLGNPNMTPVAGQVNFTRGQVKAMLYELGDLQAHNAIDASAGDAFVLDKPFFLMSAGADGAFVDFGTAAQSSWAQIISKSDDVYSFEP